VLRHFAGRDRAPEGAQHLYIEEVRGVQARATLVDMATDVPGARKIQQVVGEGAGVDYEH
jgi:hypothetical protein